MHPRFSWSVLVAPEARWGLGFRVKGLGFSAEGLSLDPQPSTIELMDLGFRGLGFEFRVQVYLEGFTFVGLSGALLKISRGLRVKGCFFKN